MFKMIVKVLGLDLYYKYTAKKSAVSVRGRSDKKDSH